MCDTVPFKVLVFIDLPDIDNILLALDVVRSHPREHIAIVLSARIVDLSVPRYGNDFSHINKSVSLEKMALPIQSEDTRDIPADVRKWFYRDADLSDSNVLRDTMLYMRVSLLRIAQIFQIYGVDPSRYSFFWNRPSEDQLPRPDMRHAFHVHDFKFNFNKDEMDAYDTATNDNRQRGNDLRVRLRGIMHTYVTRQTGELALEPKDLEPRDVQSLINANQNVSGVKIIIGGPFTEALQYLKGTRHVKPRRIVAMGASLKGDRNFFENTQFNIWKDVKAAKKFFNFVQKKKINLMLIPTECVKGTEEQPCPYELHLKDYAAILNEDSLLYSMIKQYKHDTDGGLTYSAFDWITAIAADHHDIFKWANVTLVTERDDHGERIVVKQVKKSNVCIALDDIKRMRDGRDKLLAHMRKTVEMAPENDLEIRKKRS